MNLAEKNLKKYDVIVGYYSLMTHNFRVKATLPFDFFMHSCATYKNKIWICSPYTHVQPERAGKRCWTFDGETIEEAPSLKVSHFTYFGELATFGESTI